MKKILLLILVLFAVLVAASVVLKNDQLVTVSYYFNTEFTISVGLLLISSFVLGLLSAILILFASLFKAKYVASRAKKRLDKAEKQVQSLQSLPESH